MADPYMTALTADALQRAAPSNLSASAVDAVKRVKFDYESAAPTGRTFLFPDGTAATSYIDANGNMAMKPLDKKYNPGMGGEITSRVDPSLIPQKLTDPSAPQKKTLKDYVDYYSKPENKPYPIESAVLSAGGSISGGLLPKGLAALDTLRGKDYGNSLREYEALQQVNPLADWGGALGGLAGGGVAFKTVMATPQAAKFLPWAASGAASLIGKVIPAAKSVGGAALTGSAVTAPIALGDYLFGGGFGDEDAAIMAQRGQPAPAPQTSQPVSTAQQAAQPAPQQYVTMTNANGQVERQVPYSPPTLQQAMQGNQGGQAPAPRYSGRADPNGSLEGYIKYYADRYGIPERDVAFNVHNGALAPTFIDRYEKLRTGQRSTLVQDALMSSLEQEAQAIAAAEQQAGGPTPETLARAANLRTQMMQLEGLKLTIPQQYQTGYAPSDQ